ncbi:molybdenum cofactor guanylyltransferase [Ornithinimicrobium sufpigmenti]|uniref:molybdenum cofactor guanylyltransferase n=1 Tax=Ornithinimicrobium sufpigmenti TaxID=2508882 RepID=UPI0015E17E24|nr:MULTISPECIES: NTP transferase domain-containing protein [unclassified Ornithinimicrobium]
MASSIVDLVILAGGRGSRLGGQDKAALVVGGRSLVERLLQDVDLGGVVVVVGHTPLPPLPDGRTVLQTLEDPPDGGPVAGIAAGLDALDGISAPRTPVDPAPAGGLDVADRPDVPVGPKVGDRGWVAVAAVDQPEAARALALLAAELPYVDEEVEAVSPVDSTGHRQWLLAVYRRDALTRALEALPDVRDTSVRRLVSGLHWQDVTMDPQHLGDVDTWQDVEDWARRVAHDDVTGSC